jgi:hypothetical protein
MTPTGPLEVVLKRFESPDETRVFAKGRFELVRLGALVIGRATYEPGWRWSVDVGPGLGQALCPVEHVGMVVSDVPPVPHDSWVIGDEPYVSLHFMGAEHYASK